LGEVLHGRIPGLPHLFGVILSAPGQADFGSGRAAFLFQVAILDQAIEVPGHRGTLEVKGLAELRLEERSVVGQGQENAHLTFGDANCLQMFTVGIVDQAGEAVESGRGAIGKRVLSGHNGIYKIGVNATIEMWKMDLGAEGK